MRIGITPGCPAGVGPEVIARALADVAAPVDTSFVFFGPRALLDDAARICGVTLPSSLEFADVATRVDRVQTHVTDDAVLLQRDALLAVCRAAANGDVDAIVTGPVRKRSLVVDGVAYPGQTEIVHAFVGASSEPLMVFAGGPFVLGLTTVHVPLSAVPALLTIERVVRAGTQLRNAARAIAGVDNPRVIILGVNPHAGEHGQFGHEDQSILVPAAAELQRAGIDVVGPVPADGFFADVARGHAGADAVLAMFHDQGLAPYKLLVAGEGINVTWGTRVPRTSPDHGTADALAGTGKANSSSMKAALALAIRLAMTLGAPG
jgi:4-hydroxythreonine-4-phosphate dehydrogenase